MKNRMTQLGRIWDWSSMTLSSTVVMDGREIPPPRLWGQRHNLLIVDINPVLLSFREHDSLPCVTVPATHSLSSRIT